MAYEAAHEALADAQVDARDLSLVIAANALGGRLLNQGFLRGQSWFRNLGLGDVAVINVDNSCAGGSSALHLGVRSALAEDRPVLVIGVEKMWTGDRLATIVGIEDGLPADYRAELHGSDQGNNPGGSVLMALNDAWARRSCSNAVARSNNSWPPPSRPAPMPAEPPSPVPAGGDD